MSALEAAYSRGAKLLVEAGADPNVRDDADDRPDLTPLMLATQNGDTKTVRLLLSLGADPDRVDEEGRSALAYARLRRSRPLQRLLEGLTSEDLKQKARQVFSDRKLKGLHDELVEAAKARDMKRVRALIGQGVNPDGTGKMWGEPATVPAAEAGNVEMLRFLLEAGASPTGNGGWIPLTAAAGAGSFPCVHLLLEAGANINQSGAILPPIADAAVAGHVEMVKYLLEQGADPEKSDCYGHTAKSILDRSIAKFPDHPTTPRCREALALIEAAIAAKRRRGT
jgi:ankyrin repeat protein